MIYYLRVQRLGPLSRWTMPAEHIPGTRRTTAPGRSHPSVRSDRGRSATSLRPASSTMSARCRPQSPRYRRRFLRPNSRCGLRLSPAFAAPRTYSLSPYFILLETCCIEVPEHSGQPDRRTPGNHSQSGQACAAQFRSSYEPFLRKCRSPRRPSCTAPRSRAAPPLSTPSSSAI